MSMQRANLETSLPKKHFVDNPNIKVSDKDDELEVYHYINCTNDSDEDTKKCRGLVFKDDELVLQSFPYTEEYVVPHDTEKIMSYKSEFEHIKFFQAIEGALIRIFYYNNKWYISTHRKLNAFKTKWSSRDSFGQLFLNALEHEYENNDYFKNKVGDNDDGIFTKLVNTLDKDCQYMFIVKNTGDNCIVCEETDDNLFFVGRYKNNELEFTDDIGIKYPIELSFNSLDEMVEYVKNVNERQTPGVMMFLPDNKQAKVVNSEYKLLFDTRGNQSSIKYRYLQLRMNEDDVSRLCYLYPRHQNVFDDYENILYDKAKEIYDSYVKRFIKKEYITLPKSDYEIMRVAHNWHLEDRSKNRISLNKVVDILNTQTPTILNRIIKNTILKKNQNIPEKLLPRNKESEKTDV